MVLTSRHKSRVFWHVASAAQMGLSLNSWYLKRVNLVPEYLGKYDQMMSNSGTEPNLFPDIYIYGFVPEKIEKQKHNMSW